MTREEIFKAVSAELDHAYSKHGKELWGRHEFYAILKEERIKLNEKGKS